MKGLVAVFCVCALISSTDRAGATVDWCFHLPECNDVTWPTIAAQFCNGSRQSPININSSAATQDSNLTAFTFTNFNRTTNLNRIVNTGKTVKVYMEPGVQISGGNLPDTYDTLQFHLHWGNGSSMPGSEHTVDGKRYPMEMHFVNFKSSVNGNVTAALDIPDGFTALGFFFEEASSSDQQSEFWTNLTSYLASIPFKGNSTDLTTGITLDNLLEGVDRTKYYRYLGSFTTPACNEIVIWTVFKDTIKVSKELIDLFSTSVYIYDNSSSPLMVNVYRGIQPDLPVSTQPESSSASEKTFCALVLLAPSIVLAWL